MLRRSLFVLFLVAAAHAEEFRLEEVVARVTAVEGDEATLDLGSEDGVYAKRAGYFFTVRPKASFVGIAKILAVDKRTTRVKVEPNEKKITPNVGDVVKVTARTPAIPRSPLWVFARQRCTLRYVGTTEPLVTYRGLYRKDEPDAIYAAMAAKVGVPVAEIRSFIRFRASDTWRLIGATVEVETAFAEWVKRGRRLAIDEVLERLVAAADPAARKALIEKYKTAVRFGATSLARRKAEAARRGKDLAKARQYLTIALEAVALLELDWEGARVALEEGNLLGAEGKQDEQLAAYRRARKGFVGLERPDHSGAAGALERSAWLLKGMQRYDEALAEYRLCLEQHRLRKYPRGEAFALEWIGRLLAHDKKWDESRAALTASIAKWREARDERRQADVIVILGNTLRLTGDFVAAAGKFEAAIAIFRKLKNERAEAHILNEVAAARIELKEYGAALAAAEKSVPIMRRLKDQPGLAFALRQRAIAQQRMYRREAALRDFDEALTLPEPPGRRASLLELRSACLLEMNRLPEARATSEQLVQLGKQSKDPWIQATGWRSLGGIDMALGKYDEAVPVLERAWRMFRDQKQPLHAAVTLTLVAGAREMNGDFDGALAAYREARKHDAPQAILPTLIGEVRIRRIFGELDEALAIYEKGRKLAEERGDDWSLVNIVSAGAELFADRGENERAMKTYDEVITHCERIGFDVGTAVALAKRAREWAHQGELLRALQDYEKALKLDPRPEVAAEAGYGCAESLWEVADDEHAAKFARMGVEAARNMPGRPLLSRNLLMLARVLASQAETGKKEVLAEAEKALAEADAIGRKRNAQLQRAEVQRLRGVIASLRGDGAGARDFYREALALTRGQPARHVTWLVHWGLSVTEERDGNLPGAVDQLRLCVGVLEEIRGALGGGAAAKKKFLRQRIGVYETMAELLGKLIEKEKDPAKRKQLIDEAMELVARARFERLSPEGVVTTGSKKLDDLLAKYRQAERDLTRQREQQAEAIARGDTARARSLGVVLAKTEERLVKLYHHLKANDEELGRGLAFDPRRATDRMLDAPDGATLVAYFPGEKNLLVWVFTNEGFQEWRQVPVGRAELYEFVKRYRDLVDDVADKVKSREPMGRGFGPTASTNPDWYPAHVAKMQTVLRQLHEWLLAPIASHVSDADPLLILPYGQLYYLPFEALLDANGAFVGATKRIAYFTSEAHLDEVLVGLRAPPRAGKPVWVAYANPRGDLVSSLEEAAEIKKLFGTAEVHSHATGTAGEEHLLGLREDCTILHFATHGFLNGVDPGKTYLEMDGGELTQNEIWPWLKRKVKPFRRRNVRLVVLSACETARSSESVYAEVLGMPNAFAAVGTPAIVASLWPVDTYKTTDLMIDFYRRLIKDGKDPATALRDARAALLTARDGRYAHPFYWAPFLLFGDWR